MVNVLIWLSNAWVGHDCEHRYSVLRPFAQFRCFMRLTKEIATNDQLICLTYSQKSRDLCRPGAWPPDPSTQVVVLAACLPPSRHGHVFTARHLSVRLSRPSHPPPHLSLSQSRKLNCRMLLGELLKIDNQRDFRPLTKHSHFEPVPRKKTPDLCPRIFLSFWLIRFFSFFRSVTLHKITIACSDVPSRPRT